MATQGNLGKLATRAMLMNLSIRMWEAKKTDAEVGREVAQAHGSDEEMGHFIKYLIPKEHVDRRAKIRTRAGLEHRRMTLPWGEKNLRIIQTTTLAEYSTIMRGLKAEWDREDARMAIEFDDWVETGKHRLGGLAKDREYPSLEKIQKKFQFTWLPEPLPQSSTWLLNVSDELLDAMKAEYERAETERLQTAMREVVGRITQTVGHLVKRLSDYTGERGDRMYDSVIGNIQALAHDIPLLNVTGDPALDEVADRLIQEVAKYDVEILKDSSEARHEVVLSAQDILKQMAGL